MSRDNRRGLLRELSGVLAGGLVALSGLLVVLVVIAGEQGAPGPRTSLVVGHVIAAVVVVLAQRWIDRRPGPVGSAAAVGLTAIVIVGLAVNWLL